MIFKLQWPLSPPNSAVLAYAQDMTHMRLLPINDELKKLFGGRYKLFAECQLVDGELEIGKEVPDPGW